jgi:hypothetical protein
MHFDHPEVQTIDNVLPDNRMVAVKGIAAAGKIKIFPCIRIKKVIDRIVQSPEAEQGAVIAAFGRVVEDNVQDYFYSSLV